MTSPDGITWTSRTPATGNWNSVCWCQERGVFLAVGGSGTNRTMTSPDGITWTGHLVFGGDNNSWEGVCWSPELGRFAAAAQSGSQRSAYLTAPATTIDNGLVEGQKLTLIGTDSYDAPNLKTSANVELSYPVPEAGHFSGKYTTITLSWDAVNSKWYNQNRQQY
mgnify:CR=1 FL=1